MHSRRLNRLALDLANRERRRFIVNNEVSHPNFAIACQRCDEVLHGPVRKLGIDHLDPDSQPVIGCVSGFAVDEGCNLFDSHQRYSNHLWLFVVVTISHCNRQCQ